MTRPEEPAQGAPLPDLPGLPDLAGLSARAHAWINADPDPETRAASEEIVGRGDAQELAAHFGTRVSFGTAGLRAAIGPGPARMNVLVVRQATAGIAASIPDGDRARGVVIGYDARHGSADFALHAAGVMRAAGIETWITPTPCPTPLLAFAVRHLHAAAGLMVTASHNPAADNGLKVYWSDGAQIAPPVDVVIASAITQVAGALDAHDPPGEPVEFASTRCLDAAVEEAYIGSVCALVTPHPGRLNPLRVACTSLHGVGDRLLQQTLFRSGVVEVTAVAEQAAADPDFPTVAFPNPEEPGALDMLFTLAATIDADVALANDPDADRLAVGIEGDDGSWRRLSGDEVGLLLADEALWRWQEHGAARLLVTTVVSSQAIARLAQVRGVHFVETLTGFKCLSRPALSDPGLVQCLAYEEALGYAIGPESRDKDGIAAAVFLCDAIARWRRGGLSVSDKLAELAAVVGERATDNRSVRLSGGVSGADVAGALAQSAPTEFAGRGISRTDRPAEDVFRWWLDDGTRVVVRPSGTEPKVKLYVEACREQLGVAGQDSTGSRVAPSVVDSARAVADVVEQWLTELAELASSASS